MNEAIICTASDSSYTYSNVFRSFKEILAGAIVRIMLLLLVASNSLHSQVSDLACMGFMGYIYTDIRYTYSLLVNRSYN